MMQRYEKYKDSGVEWIGEIPEGWEVASLKWVSKIYSGGTPDKNNADYWFNGTIPWLNSGTVNQFIITNPSEYITEDGFHNSSAKWIDKNSIVIALAGQGKTKGIAALVTFKTTCNQSLGIIKPNAYINSKYLLYYLRRNYLNIRGLAGEGKRDGLNLEMIGSISIPLFDKIEQTTIANYLDRKTAEIDQLITQKEALIGLYEEEKTAIINQAVTQGINPDVKLKESGIDWLGEIPEHWGIKKIKFIISHLESGVSVNSTDFPATDKSYGILKTSCVYEYIFEPSKNKEIWQSELIRAKIKPRKGEIIISRMNTPELVGASGYVDKDYEYLYLPDRLWQTVFRIGITIDTKWLSYVLKSIRFRMLLSFTATGSSPSMKNLTQEDFMKITIPFPVIDEQTAIVKHIETQVTRINAKISKTKKIIALQKEYRTALISEVVTGKIKVTQEMIS